jgi:hypothetical protein
MQAGWPSLTTGLRNRRDELRNGDWQGLDGKPISIFYFATRDEGVCPYIEAKDGTTLRLRAEYMGDRTETWIVAEHNGVETARHNCRHVESIVWLNDALGTEQSGV